MSLPPNPDNGAPAPGPADGVRPPRQETFLARYPRKLKLAVTGAFLVIVCIVPLFLGGGEAAKKTASQSAKPKNAIVKTDPAFHAANANGTSKQSEQTVETPAINNTAPIIDTAETAAIIALNDTNDRNARMARAPDPGLTDDTAEGSLPKIGEDGRKPWQVYARPFDNADKRPRISIVMLNMGMSRIATDAALQKLPASVTLGFDVQSPVIGAWLGRARQDGHELLISIPMEPFDYPRSDPGPNTLLTNLPNSDNLQRLTWALRQGTGYIGITSLSGSRFMTNPSKMTPVLQILKDRGLMIFDPRIAPHSAVKDLAKNMGVPVAASMQRIDENFAPDAIDAVLTQLEQTARLNGRAIGYAIPLPVTIDRLDAWIRQLPAHGIALAPLSAMVE